MDVQRIDRSLGEPRQEMRGTIDEIQDRLRPDHLMQQARDTVTQAATGKAKTMMNSARQTASNVAARASDAGTYLADYATAHPIRIAVTIGALTWWMLRGRGRSGAPAARGGRRGVESESWQGAADTDWDDADVIVYGDRRSLRDKAGEYAESARQQARRASQRVRSAASTATTQVDDWVHEYPIAAGAIALAVGAAVGLSAPRTEWEDCTMGETRDRAWEKASQAAANIKDNVTQKVATATENLVGESINAAMGTPEPRTSDTGRM